MKMNAKQIGLTVLLGSLVVILTPILASLFSGLGFLNFELFTLSGMTFTLATAVAAGLAAFLADFVITKYLR